MRLRGDQTPQIARLAGCAVLVGVITLSAHAKTANTAARASVAAPAERDRALVEAAQQDDAVHVSALLHERVDVNAAQADGMTALHWAAYNDDVVLVKKLLAAGARSEQRTRLRGIAPLHLAAESGDAALLEALLAGGASARTKNETGTTALMIAAASGSVAAVETLIRHGADVNAQETAHGQSALFFAAARNRADVIRVLLTHGANLNARTTITKLSKPAVGPDGESAEDRKPTETDRKADPAAARHAESAVAQAESATKKQDDGAKPGAKPEDKAKDAYGFTAADRKKRVFGTTQIGGLTPLLLAARNGQIDALNALLDGGANINDVSSTDHATALVLALINGHYDTAMHLVARGADVKLATSDGVTPLYAAIDVQWAPHTWYPQPVTANEKTTYIDVVNALLAHGADPNAAVQRRLWFRVFANDETWIDVEGATPAFRAAMAGDLDAIKLLAEHGGKLDARTAANDSPLMAAAGVGWAAYWTSNAPSSRLDVVKFLLEHGVELRTVDAKGYTALHGAAFRGDNEMVKYLLAQGADIHATTKDGDTVADLANGLFEHSVVHPETVALLESMGSANSHNCRSNECVVPTKEDKPVVVAEAKDGKQGSKEQ